MMHIVNNMMKFLKLNLFSTIKCHIQIFKKWMIRQIQIQNQKHCVQLAFGLTT
jgi:hypothetical protein